MKKRKIRNLPWGRKKHESAMKAFSRQARSVTQADQKRLVAQGWKPIEAAVEAWLTQEAGDGAT